MLKTFSPSGSTVSIAATSVSASAALDPNSSVVRVHNKGPNIAFLSFASTAALTDMPIASGSTETFTKARASAAAVVCAVGETASLYFTNGEGL